MLKKITDKLRSERGASLSMALLLFVVCAVVGGVILASATAAAGRMSQLADMDQRYYSVSSAAEVLENELCGHEVVITATSESYVQYSNSSSETDPEGVESEESIPVRQSITVSLRNPDGSLSDAHSVTVNADGSNLSDKLLLNVSYKLWQMYNDPSATSMPSGSGYKLVLSAAPENSKLDADMSYSFDADGILTITLSGGYSDNARYSDSDKYSVYLSLVPELSVEDVIREEEEDPADGTKRIITTKETQVISWSAGKIQ